ncbi:MAG: hypothetical protein Q8O67_32620 [Deltaproteobacteria bacterium]|nr:hypothetical protein [Deltaproteobacteria bacterium]
MHLSVDRSAIQAERLLRPLVELRAAAFTDLMTLHPARLGLSELESARLVRVVRAEGRVLVALGPASRTLFPCVPASRLSGAISPPILAWGWTRAALRAAHRHEGWSVDDGDAGRGALLSVLVGSAERRAAELARAADARSGMAKAEAAAAIAALQSLTELQASSRSLGWDIAWRASAAACTAQHGQGTEVRVLFVEHPFQSLKRQLSSLPLQVVGQPRVSIVLRPAEDGSVVDKDGTALVRGARWRSLLRAFTKTTRPGAGFPLWVTADVVHYRPELFFRVMRRGTP